MECWKMIAAMLVVFDHAWFPGKLGSVCIMLCTFAVPLFFMICGYFNYQATPKQIAQRTKHIIDLLLMGTFIHIVWGCIATELNGGSTIAYLRAAIPDPDEIVRFVVLHVHPYAGHLWYLISSAAVYIAFYAYTCFFSEKCIDYKYFYQFCFILFCITFSLDTVASAAGSSTGLFTRCGWFIGFPMFGIGLFIREYQERIFSIFSFSGKKLLFFAFLGAGFTLLQGFTTGIQLLPMGTLVGVISLMLFFVSHPTVPVKSRILNKVIGEFGPISTWIYLFHLMFILCYEEFLKETFVAFAGNAEPYLFPIFILLQSLSAAILCQYLAHRHRKTDKHKK